MHTKRLATAIALCLMLLGVLMVCQPFFHVLFRWGFLVIIVGVLAFTIATHLKEPHA